MSPFSSFLRSILVVPALLLLLAGCSGDGSAKSSKPFIEAPVFYPAGRPDFSLAETVRSKPALLVFWATWCENCLAEIPEMNELVHRYSGKLEIVSINVGEEADQVKKFLSETSLEYPVILDAEGEISGRFEVTAIPSVVLLAKGGEILYYGFRLPETQKMDEALSV